MASFTDTWNAAFEALPPDVGEAINLGPDRIRDHKLAVRQRMEIDHKWDEAADPTHHGKHAKISWFEQASEPGDPDAGTAVSAGFAIPSEAEAGSGILTKDNGANEWRQGIDGGVNELDGAANHDFRGTNVWGIGQLLIITPTAARTIILPTTEVGRGWFVDIMNLATTAPETNHVIVKSSNVTEIRRVLPGQTIRFTATEGTPTEETHWEFPGGLIYADATDRTTDTTIYTLPANLIRAAGQGLRLRAVVTDAIDARYNFKLGGTEWADAPVDMIKIHNIVKAEIFWDTLSAAHIFGLIYSGSVTGQSLISLNQISTIATIDNGLATSGTLALAWDTVSGSPTLVSVTLELIK